MKTGKKRNWIKWLLVSILALVVLYLVFVVVVVVISVSDNFEARKFNTTDWKQKPEKRFELVDDLMKSKLLDGKSRAEVTKVLGPPETNTPKSEKDKMVNGLYSHFPDTTGSGTDLFYFLGTRPGIMQAEQYFFIWLENGSVMKYKIRGTFE